MAISPKVGGRIVRIVHDMGDIVRPGDVLLEIDDTDSRLAVDEAARALESELAKLALDKLPPADLDVTQLPAVKRARLLVENATHKFQRAETLRMKNVSTQDEFDQVKTDLEVAKVDFQQAELDARATLATARHRQATLATAQQKLRDTRVVVPFPSVQTGPATFVIAERMVSEGEMVQSSPATESFRLVIDDPLKLKATVPERHVGDLKVGQQATLLVEAYPDQTFQGAVSRINPTVDHISRTFQIEVLVSNAERKLRPGSFAKAEVLTRSDTQARTVPEESLVSFAGVRKVFVVRDGRAVAVEVRIGVRGDGWLEVFGDLRPDDQIVTTGYTQLAEGTAVRVRNVATASRK